MFSEERIRKILYASAGIGLLALGVFLFFRYLFGALLPFLTAYLIAFCLQPLARAMEKRAGISRKATVLIAVCLIVALLLFLGTVTVRRISKELTTLAESLGAFLERVRNDPAYADELADKWSARLPFLDMHAVFADLDGRLTALLTSLAERLSGSVLPFLASLAASLPSALLSIAVVLIASYYFATDFRKFNAGVQKLLPQKLLSPLQTVKNTLTQTGGSFLRAYGLLMLITFSELFSALLILGYRYAFLIALFTAMIDILPVLGTGTVLLPWTAFCFLTGNTKGGIGLLIVYAVITVVRQILEPRIVGKYIGLPPLASLAAMYIGLRLIGFWGLFLFPVGVLLVYKVYLAKSARADATST